MAPQKILWGNVGQLSKWDEVQGVHYLYEFMTKFCPDSETGLGVCKHLACSLKGMLKS